jgi:hypothetical protein
VGRQRAGDEISAEANVLTQVIWERRKSHRPEVQTFYSSCVIVGMIESIAMYSTCSTRRRYNLVQHSGRFIGRWWLTDIGMWVRDISEWVWGTRQDMNWVTRGHGSRYSSVTIALSYGLDDWEFESRQRLGIFLFTTASRPSLGLSQPPIQWVPGALFLEVKRPGREAYHSPPSSAEIKNCGAFPSFPQYAFIAWCLVNTNSLPAE